MSLQLSADILNQYRALTAAVGFVDVSSRTQIEITGADRARFLHGFCTNDINRLKPGDGCEAFLTNAKGRVLGHVFVFCEEARLVLETVPGQAEKIIAHLDRYVIREDVRLQSLSGQLSELCVAGRQSELALSRSIGATAPPKIMSHATGMIDDIAVSLRRVPLAADAAFLVSCPADRLALVTEKLIAAGAEACAPEALEIVRVEAVFPFYGRDITEDNLPQEVNRNDRAISFTKGCYLGQETVARIDALGHVNRSLVSLRWDQAEIPPTGQELVVDGRTIGHVTSAVWSPRFSAPVSLAYLRQGHDQPGQQIDTSIGSTEVLP
jgi:folate-binding protein YgfZ